MAAASKSDIFMLITNNVNGESTDAEFKDHLDILSYSWGVTQQGTFHMSGGAGGGAGRSSVQDLHCTKTICKASPELMIKCATGVHIDKATLFVRKAGGKPYVYFKFEMTKVLVSSYQTGSGGNQGGAEGALINEQFSLNFEQLNLTYWQQDPKGGQGTAVPKVYNIAQNTENPQ